MKICMLAEFLPPAFGGAACQALRLAGELRRMGLEVFFLGRRERGFRHLDSTLDGFSVIRVGVGSPGKMGKDSGAAWFHRHPDAAASALRNSAYSRTVLSHTRGWPFCPPRVAKETGAKADLDGFRHALGSKGREIRLVCLVLLLSGRRLRLHVQCFVRGMPPARPA